MTKKHPPREREEELPQTEIPAPEPEKDDTYDRLVRVTADFDNFRKRVQKEKAELVRYGNETLVREILPVLDNFERAIEHGKKNSDLDALRAGIEMILSQLKNALDRFGVRSESALTKKFDPLIHEAVSHVEHPDHPPNHVVTEHQKAYFLHDRLIRPALVTVAKEAPSANAQSQDSEESSEKAN